ncbi:hypothetical protein DAPPUDRAFT_244821 [Daphnia pulex]|uniref:Uncharacterized protein n=1 Tax=Daphnia pulex TaxID=6669 RepID=E9GLX8_DAPPU|nr:hypothetical protein DAPPUDRAFT_244821 [Daphnia pulex]|eukprot:EFX79613.1 hypothetical protein DAPPUDRAFT_244821 [Daphnia pulex]
MHEVRLNEDGRMVNRKLLSKALKLENQGLLVDFAWKETILAEEVHLNELVIKGCDNIEIPVSLQKIGNLKVISTKLSVPAFEMGVKWLKDFFYNL